MKAPQPENRGRRYAGDLTRRKRRQDGRRAPHGKCSRRGVAVAQEGAAELPRKRTAFPATATAFSAGGAPRANFKALRPAREMFPAGRLMQGAPSFPSGIGMRIVDAAIHGAPASAGIASDDANKGFRAIREGIFAMNVGLSGSATSRRGTQWKKAWPSVLSSPSAETLP